VVDERRVRSLGDVRLHPVDGLESATGPVEGVVIDSVERPTED
jgi:hypothetical protein